jgi:DNA-binding LytR/AlgR family response regulator
MTCSLSRSLRREGRLDRSYIVALREIVELRLESRRDLVKIANVDLEVPVSRAKVTDLRARLRGPHRSYGN